tara:strand:- start:78 stop:845 length:768 start_codon:yes stop_codon:yes gene_type:complete
MAIQQYYSLSPQTYNDQFWWKKDDIEFWKNLLKKDKSKTLELAAGTGRLAIPLIREKINYTGLELSKNYCEYANEQIGLITKKNKIVQGDMRFFNLDQTFDNIFIGFNSLLHILNEKDLIKTLGCIKKHMNNKSSLFIDIFVPHTLFLSRKNNELIKVCEFFDSINKTESSIYEQLKYNHTNEIVDVKWFYKANNRQYEKFNFKMKMYYPDTMNRILIDSGFKIESLWGDYDKSQFHSESALQIYQCKLNKRMNY